MWGGGGAAKLWVLVKDEMFLNPTAPYLKITWKQSFLSSLSCSNFITFTGGKIRKANLANLFFSLALRLPLILARTGVEVLCNSSPAGVQLPPLRGNTSNCEKPACVNCRSWKRCGVIHEQLLTSVFSSNKTLYSFSLTIWWLKKWFSIISFSWLKQTRRVCEESAAALCKQVVVLHQHRSAFCFWFFIFKAIASKSDVVKIWWCYSNLFSRVADLNFSKKSWFSLSLLIHHVVSWIIERWLSHWSGSWSFFWHVSVKFTSSTNFRLVGCKQRAIFVFIYYWFFLRCNAALTEDFVLIFTTCSPQCFNRVFLLFPSVFRKSEIWNGVSRDTSSPRTKGDWDHS